MGKKQINNRLIPGQKKGMLKKTLATKFVYQDLPPLKNHTYHCVEAFPIHGGGVMVKVGFRYSPDGTGQR